MTLAGTVLTAKMPLFWIKSLKSNEMWSKLLSLLEGEYQSVAWLQFCCDTVRKLNENHTTLSLVQDWKAQPCQQISQSRQNFPFFPFVYGNTISKKCEQQAKFTFCLGENSISFFSFYFFCAMCTFCLS